MAVIIQFIISMVVVLSFLCCLRSTCWIIFSLWSGKKTIAKVVKEASGQKLHHFPGDAGRCTITALSVHFVGGHFR